MNWKKYISSEYLQYLNNGYNSLLSKVMDFKHIDQTQMQMMNKMLFHDYHLFDESQEVYERILGAIDSNEKICIYGDYDCDGILATSILVKTFKMLGKDVGYHIPNRFSDGYGLNETRVKQMAEKGYSLIITVDNGIKALDAIDLANELGVDVIVTDHHAISDDLPNAYAFLHTKLSPNYPFKEISGGMVAYKLAYQLLQKHDRYLFCLAAITTISDMMPIVNENRAIVKKALQIMNEYHFPALDLLLGENQTYNVTSIGFIIAPKINSFGRLPDEANINLCVKYFLMGDHSAALKQPFMHEFAKKAIEINKKRQSLTNQLYVGLKPDIQSSDNFIFLYEKPVHEGIVGLLAGKFAKEFNKVSFVMNYDEKNNLYKGSARSVNGFKLNQFLETASEDLLFFGGHDLAAGFSVKYDRIPCFYNKIKTAIENTVFEEEKISCLVVDEHDLTLENVNSLKLLEPYGNGNEEPIFCIEKVLIKNIVSLTNGKHLRLECMKNNVAFNALYFNCGEKLNHVEQGTYYDIFGTLSVNEYRSYKSIQMILKDVI